MIPIEELRQVVQDPNVTLLRDSVETQWEQATGYLWRVETNKVVEFTTDGTKGTLYLDHHYVDSVSKVEVASTFERTWEEIDVDVDWSFQSPRMLVRDGKWEPYVRVTYTGGYTDTTTPDLVKYVLRVQAQFLHERLKNLTVRSQNFEGGSGVFEMATEHPLFKQLAKRYKRVVI